MAILLFSFAAAAPAAAGQPEGATDLAAGLDRIARSHRVNLLFDERLVAGKRISVRATPSTIERELAQTLKGTGLTYRNAGGGTFVIIADTTGDKAPTPEAPPPPVPDILVIGRYTLDTDIRRSADDAQPYRTAGRRSIEDAQPGSVEEFLKTRLPQNAQTLSLNQAPFSAGGSPRSQIDLRGLGTDHTLVLVNGRRLPSTPGLGELLQPDVSGMPIQGIDRIETLASTAGGIFGIGADGGAVNIVTKNDFDEAALSVQTGLSGRGDAAQRMIDAHIGWTSASKHTRVSLRYTDRTDEGLSFGSRDFIESSRTLRYQRVGSRNYLPVSASVNVVSATGSNLSLIPALGGQSLGASSTFLPLGPAAASSVGIAALLTNAGKLDLTLAQDGQGAEQSLLTPADAHSVLATVRQDVGRSLVVYADYLRFSTTGRAVIGGVQTTTSLSPGQLGNPFAQPIIITYPAAGLLGQILSRSTTDRLTIGAIAQLGKGWVANFDAASGQATVFQVESYTPVSGYAINAFAGGTALTSQLARVAVTPFFQNYATNRLRDLNLRVAGPLVNLPAGPLSITLTAELRDERAPGADYDNYVSTPALRSSTHYQSARQTVGSAFAEARIPIVSNDASKSVLRGLEAQVAVRTDRYEIAAPVIDAQLLQLGTFGNEVRSKGTVTAVTTSLRFNPTDGITLRGSYADGYTPPTQSQITPNGFSFGFFPYSDPKRPRDSFASSIQTLFLYGGQPGFARKRRGPGRSARSRSRHSSPACVFHSTS
ncbi:TonB-dependent receptor [Sphingomonas glacialis]|uniref:Secretin/TonB short N-terminal domain-containing protein n=1 Tax=Sphingomonas glacialis TaxID=658225 RepID=A0A502FRN6_9SPHN|nr:TonB-dependent receptor [Sphingomonas glacialis]TPG52071.1 hypothetical protein EAH76_15245 [Sphingomonas glacialis]